MDLAPIVLFVYNRPWHTQQTLEALAKNVHADESELFVFADGPKEDASSDDLKNIKEVRKIVKSAKGFEDINIEERNKNLGLADNVIDGVTRIVNEHGKVIVLEDDILTGMYFLKFMNEALSLYQNDNKVFGISGYKYSSVKEIKNISYFLPIGSSWSYATWADRWAKINFDGKKLLSEMKGNNAKKSMNFGGYPFYEMLENQVLGNNDSWAIRFYASMFLEKGMFLYPNRSLVANIGFDNSGTHCSPDEYFSKVEISNDKIHLQKNKLDLNSKIVYSFEKSFKSRMNGNKNNSRKRTLIQYTKKSLKKVLKKLQF